MASRPPATIEPHPRVGVVFDVKRFEKPDARGCAHGCDEVGWQDFGGVGYKLNVREEVQVVRIHQNAQKNGDAGIQRHFEARADEVYRLTAVVRIKRQKGPFKCRVNISPRKLNGPQTGTEGNRSQEETTDNPVKVVCEQKMHSGTEQVTVRVKFHTFDPGEGGEGEIYSWKLERLR